jgi:hypothetical protein
MIRKFGIGAAVIGALVITAGLALAAVTWHSGPTFDLVYNSDGVAVGAIATGDGSGFGNQPAVATIKLDASVSYTCQNQGGNQAPGRNPVPESTSGSQDLGNADHNGRGVINLTVTFSPAATVPGKSIGCPNGHWTGVDPVFNGITGATLTITQGGKTIYTATLP